MRLSFTGRLNPEDRPLAHVEEFGMANNKGKPVRSLLISLFSSFFNKETLSIHEMSTKAPFNGVFAAGRGFLPLRFANKAPS